MFHCRPITNLLNLWYQRLLSSLLFLSTSRFLLLLYFFSLISVRAFFKAISLYSNVLADLLQVGLNLLSEISFLHFQQEERRRNLRFKYSNFHSHSVIASAVWTGLIQKSDRTKERRNERATYMVYQKSDSFTNEDKHQKSDISKDGQNSSCLIFQLSQQQYDYKCSINRWLQVFPLLFTTLQESSFNCMAATKGAHHVIHLI